MNRQITIKANNPKEFFTALIKFVGSFYELSISLDKELLIELAGLSQDGSVMIDPTTRKKLLLDLNVKNTHLSNSFKRLKDKGLLTGKQGKYELNPIMVWRNLEDAIQNDDLKLTIKFIK